MEYGIEKPEVRRAMERATDLIMCSTCAGFMFRKERTSVPKPDEEVVEVVRKAEKMRDLLKMVVQHGPLQEMEPAEATKEQWQVLRSRRRILMETKRCPACSGSLLELCEFMAALGSQGGKERTKIAMVADANSEHELKRSREEGKRSFSGLKEKKALERSMEEGKRSSNGLKEKKKALKRSREEGKGSSSGLKKKAKSEDKEGSGSKKKAKRSSEMEGSEWKEAKTLYGEEESRMQLTRLFTRVVELLEQPPVKPKEEENSESAVGNSKTKMVTMRMDKKTVDNWKNLPPRSPISYDQYLLIKSIVDDIAAFDAVYSLFLAYLRCYCCIKGYAEYQVEVTDDEGDDHKLV